MASYLGGRWLSKTSVGLLTDILRDTRKRYHAAAKLELNS